MADPREAGKKSEMQKRLDAAHQVLTSGIFVLSLLENAPRRNYTAEQFVAQEITEQVGSMALMNLAIGIDVVEGMGMWTSKGSPKAWVGGITLGKRLERIREDKLHGPDAHKIERFAERERKGSSFMGLHRADMLGYPELGRRWFLLFGGTHGETMYAPIQLIQNVQLKPHDTGF